MAKKHPEWRMISEQGCWVGARPYEDSFWHMMCVNTPYRKFLKKHVREVLESVPVDGLFFDIVTTRPCSCEYCQADMQKKGMDPSNDTHRAQFAKTMIHEWIHETTDFVRQYNKDCSIFYNSGHIGPRHREIKKSYTHFELESLPSGGWGYLDFPLTQRYARTLGLDCMGMTGKFHTTWGDFHSFKNKAALEFEVFQMLALNAKCSIGDQLHPNGQLDPFSYKLIGSVYSEVEKKEPWCKESKAVTEIGVITPEAFHGGGARKLPFSALGLTRMLQEGKYQFDVLDSENDFSPYRILILPDNVPVSDSLRNKLETFVNNGGSLIASFESGLTADKSRFNLPSLGVSKTGDGPVDERGDLARGKRYPKNNYAEYIIPTGVMGKNLNPTEYVMYIKGLDIAATTGSKVLANITKSYFNRTWKHYCSHRQTPSAGELGKPAIVQNGRTIYFSHPIFSQYEYNAPLWYKKLFFNALNVLLTDPLVETNAPSTALMTINEQAQQKRWVVHFLHYIPERRGRDFDVIEDVISLSDVNVSIKIPHKVTNVTRVPDNTSISYKQQKGRVQFTLDKLNGHQMVALEY
jgi:hypothetical protein